MTQRKVPVLPLLLDRLAVVIVTLEDFELVEFREMSMDEIGVVQG